MDDKLRVIRPVVNGKVKYARILLMNKYPLPNEDTDPLNAIAMYARYGMLRLRFCSPSGAYTALSNILCELSRMDAAYSEDGEEIKVDCKQLHEYGLHRDEVVRLHNALLLSKESVIKKQEANEDHGREEIQTTGE